MILFRGLVAIDPDASYQCLTIFLRLPRPPFVLLEPWSFGIGCLKLEQFQFPIGTQLEKYLHAPTEPTTHNQQTRESNVQWLLELLSRMQEIPLLNEYASLHSFRFQEQS